MSIRENVLTILETHKGKWPDLCRESGVSYNWLIKFYHGERKNPGIDNIEKIIAWDTKKSSA